MTFSGLRGPASSPSAPLSVAVFGVLSGLCVLAAVLLAAGQWPDDDAAPMVEFVPALLLAGLAVHGAILCAGFACLIAAVARGQATPSSG